MQRLLILQGASNSEWRLGWGVGVYILVLCEEARSQEDRLSAPQAVKILTLGPSIGWTQGLGVPLRMGLGFLL